MMPTFIIVTPASFIIASMAKVVSGEIALHSTKMVLSPLAFMVAAISAAKPAARSGGMIENMKSLSATSSLRSVTSSMPTRSARVLVRSLRPDNTVITRWPFSTSTPATAWPISPGLIRPIVGFAIIFPSLIYLFNSLIYCRSF